MARNRVLLHLVDVAPVDGSHPLDNVILIENELLAYSDAFAERPVVIVFNKIDLLDDEALEVLRNEFAQEYPERTVLAISAVTGAGVDAMVHYIQDQIAALKEQLADDETAQQADADLQARISNDVMAHSLGVVAPEDGEAATPDELNDDYNSDDDSDDDVEVIYTNE